MNSEDYVPIRRPSLKRRSPFEPEENLPKKPSKIDNLLLYRERKKEKSKKGIQPPQFIRKKREEEPASSLKEPPNVQPQKPNTRSRILNKSPNILERALLKKKSEFLFDKSLLIEPRFKKKTRLENNIVEDGPNKIPEEGKEKEGDSFASESFKSDVEWRPTKRRVKKS